MGRGLGVFVKGYCVLNRTSFGKEMLHALFRRFMRSCGVDGGYAEPPLLDGRDFDPALEGEVVKLKPDGKMCFAARCKDWDGWVVLWRGGADYVVFLEDSADLDMVKMLNGVRSELARHEANAGERRQQQR